MQKTMFKKHFRLYLMSVFAVISFILGYIGANNDTVVFLTNNWVEITLFYFVISVLGILIYKSTARNISSIEDVLEQIRARLVESNEDITALTGEFFGNAKKQSLIMRETTSTLNQISNINDKASAGALEAGKRIDNNSTLADEGVESVGEIIKSIDNIGQSNQFILDTFVENNQEMSNIINLINDISIKTQVINDIVFQTKLLSFNASVEAARAGDHGKGFAVVAEEIGNLAQMSGRASLEINEIVAAGVKTTERIAKQSSISISKLKTEGQGKIENGLHIARHCGDVFDLVVQSAKNINSSITDLSNFSEEQASDIKEASDIMSDLNDVNHRSKEIYANTEKFKQEIDFIIKDINQVMGVVTHDTRGVA